MYLMINSRTLVRYLLRTSKNDCQEVNVLSSGHCQQLSTQVTRSFYSKSRLLS